MATQDATSIPFSAARAQQAFKLLELPADLLALLESDNPPTLSLHAPTPSSPALLTTPTSTYRLQQKNTSNPLMLLRPSTTAAAAAAATAAPAPPNKWHAKFAASRNAPKK